MALVASTIIAFSLAMPGNSGLEDIDSVERQAISNRLAIQRWHIRISYSYEGKPLQGVATETIDYCDGTLMRRDIVRAYEERLAGVNEDHYTSMEVWNNAERYLYGTERFADGTRRGLQVTRRDVAMKELGNRKVPFSDIRILGFLPYGRICEGEITDFVGNPDRTNLRMTDDVINGISCKKISFDKTRNKLTANCDIWIAPNMGYSVVRNRITRKGADGEYVYCTNLTVKEYPNSKLWFPSASICEVFENGKQTMCEKLDIKVFSLNAPLNPRFFTIADLNVTPGTRVICVPGSEDADFIWDGKEIRRMTGNELLGEKVKPLGWSSRQYTLIITAILLAVTSGIFLWRRFSQPHAKRAA